MLVQFLKQYAGKEVGDIANLDASLGLMLVRDGMVQKVDKAEYMKPRDLKPIPEKPKQSKQAAKPGRKPRV